MPNITKNHAIICLYYYPRRFVIFACRYFKLRWNTTALGQSNWRNYSCSSIKVIKQYGIGLCFKPIWFSIITRISHFQEIGCVTSRLLDSLRSKRFYLVSDQRKTKEGNFRFWPREKWNETLLFHLRHFLRFLWLSSLVVCSETKQKRWLRRLIAGQPLPSPSLQGQGEVVHGLADCEFSRAIFTFFRN